MSQKGADSASSRRLRPKHPVDYSNNGEGAKVTPRATVPVSPQASKSFQERNAGSSQEPGPSTLPQAGGQGQIWTDEQIELL